VYVLKLTGVSESVDCISIFEFDFVVAAVAIRCFVGVLSLYRYTAQCYKGTAKCYTSVSFNRPACA
jgi:hypothetical protein